MDRMTMNDMCDEIFNERNKEFQYTFMGEDYYYPEEEDEEDE